MRGRGLGIHVMLSFACLSCGGGSANDGSTGPETGDNGAEEEGGADGAVDPGPEGIGCGEAWEGWWDGAADNEAVSPPTLLAPEGRPQRGRWHAHGGTNVSPRSRPPRDQAGEEFRATLISETAVLTTGRNLGVSWCLANIFPSPFGPGGSIDEEEDAVNLERYLLFRREFERATRIWERHSRMNFVHLVSLDDRRKPSGGACDPSLEHVWFRAQTDGCNTEYHGATNAGGKTEFDPAAASPQNPDGYLRLLCIAWQFLEAGKSLVPVYAAHESGHIVGLEHEHVRWAQDDH